MTVKELKNKKTKEVLNLLIKEFNIHTIERDNQYIRFWMDDSIYGSLDTRDFNIDLNDDNYPRIEIFDYELLMNKKVRELVAS